jgi:hypothetical protein
MLMRTLLFGVRPWDVSTLVAVAMVLELLRCWRAMCRRGERLR